ncbi:MAG: aldo/keto reductase [Candidatus Izemoplasma sp.]
MEKRKMLKLNKEPSLLGFGCMRFPTKNNKIDFDEAKKMIDFAVKNGVNYIDTAYFYHDGESERVVKEIIKDYKREDFYLADKMPLWMAKNKEDVSKIFEDQLEKTGVEYFDFYLVHAVSKERLIDIEKWDVMEILDEYKAQGKIKHIGFSFHDDLETFKKAVDIYDWDFCQIQLNYMDIDHQQGIEGYNLLTEKDIPVIVMEPIRGGSLAKFNPAIEKILTDSNSEVTMASWALRWVGSLPNVKVILSGMSTMEHVIDNLKTFTDFKPLNPNELELIAKVRENLLSLIKVDCTSCNYCMPCEYGVDIPGNFRIFNQHSMYKNDGHAKWSYSNIDSKNMGGDQCVECNECMPKCPQNIEIPTRLAEMQEYLIQNGIK